jgi:AraC-like DNA-binding protein
MERSENAALDSLTPNEPQFDCLANSLVQLLETAKQDLERDRQAAKASLAKASSILQLEIDRRSSANGSGTGGLAGWQIARVRAFIDKNLHGTIHTRDLSAVARRSAAHFARSFKHTFGESPHAYVMRRRLEKACHLSRVSRRMLAPFYWELDVTRWSQHANVQIDFGRRSLASSRMQLKLKSLP